MDPSSFLQLSVLLIVAAFSIPIARKISVIEIPVLILLGLLLGPVTGIISHGFAISLMSNFGTVGIGLLGIMIILYAESHHIDFKVFRRQMVKIAMLDTLGLLITAFVAAFLFSYITHAPLIIGFIFGAIISPTDPASVIPLFRRMTISEDVSGVITGESMFNDPLGIILVYLGLALVNPNMSEVALFSTLSGYFGIFGASASYLIMQVTIPAITGAAIGFAIIYLNRVFDFENLLVGLLLGVILLEFAFFEALSLTPFTAIIATGAVIGNFSDKSIFWEREENFQRNLSFLAQSLIFLLLGSILQTSDLTEFALLGILMSLSVMFVARPLAVFPSLFLSGSVRSRSRFSNKVKAFIAMTGPRGVVSVVMSAVPLALGEAYQIPVLLQYGKIIYVATAFVVLVSIILTTVYAPLVSKKLLPSPNNDAEKS